MGSFEWKKFPHIDVGSFEGVKRGKWVKEEIGCFERVKEETDYQ